MKIAIIGSGNVGTALATRWVLAGHEVSFGVRNPESAKARKAIAQVPGTRLMPISDAVQAAAVVVLTTPPDAVSQMIAEFGALTGKVIIDATNAIRTKPDPYETAFHAVKAISGHPDVVKCFNTTGFENMLNPIYNSQGIDVFCAGNSAHAKEVAKQLALDAGFGQCWDFGGDDQVKLQEHLAMCWINLAIMQGHSRNIAMTLISRPTNS